MTCVYFSIKMSYQTHFWPTALDLFVYLVYFLFFFSMISGGLNANANVTIPRIFDGHATHA